ncbi:outer membrane beta-barrel protein [Cyclobacterium plantarum]|uniref:Porin family protein n=1 Tax=Cyclobacterium plantarum TaxID=2716263 RepID=A0ABX0H7J5_9BACT|nr:outer membrane beta-barrel protein [Cyclobacterium plantarum]NHE57624.1 porin family protein [Cyclobacterium plantarum]
MKTLTNFSAAHNLFVGALAITLLLSSMVVQAQDRWSLEFRPGVNLPTQKLGDADLKTGYGFEGSLAYSFLPHLSVYGGWSWNRFGADQSFAGANTDFEETGYTYGLQFIHPISTSNLSLLLRAGGLANHIELENSDGDIIADSGHGFGWQVEAGVSIPISEKWRAQPGLRYRALSRDVRLNGSTFGTDLNYISLGIGIVKVF